MCLLGLISYMLMYETFHLDIPTGPHSVAQSVKSLTADPGIASSI